MPINVGDLVWVCAPTQAAIAEVQASGRLWRVTELRMRTVYALPFYSSDNPTLGYPFHWHEIEPYTGQLEEEQADDHQSR